MTTTITARIDSDRKSQAEAVFADLGLTFSSAINLFVNAVVMNQGIPFRVERRARGFGGMKLGLAKGKWQLPSDFDEKFDSYDAENEKLMVGGAL